MKTINVFLFLILSVILVQCGSSVKSGSDVVISSTAEIIDCKKNSLNALQENDTLTIFYETHGCEHFYTEVLKIFRTSQGFSSNLSTLIPYKKYRASIDAELGDSDVEAFYNFESAGKNMRDSGLICTTHNKYAIISKLDTILKFEENNCSFEEYYKLKISLFGERRLDNYWKTLNK